MARSQTTGPGRASPVPVVTVCAFHAPYAGEFFAAAPPGSSPLPWPSPRLPRLGSLCCPPEGGTLNDAAGFASCCGPHSCFPLRAFDAGLRPDPFPDRAASLLPGLLAATRTGLAPAGDDELVVVSSTQWPHLQLLDARRDKGRDRSSLTAPLRHEARFHLIVMQLGGAVSQSQERIRSQARGPKSLGQTRQSAKRAYSDEHKSNGPEPWRGQAAIATTSA
jgi:hypothetical protein